jgi:Ca2+-binding EF-hand superfamily protein
MHAYQRGLFKGMDDDGNGAISRAELGDKVPRWVENFAVIDADANGEVSADELKAHRQKMRAEHRAQRPQREG